MSLQIFRIATFPPIAACVPKAIGFIPVLLLKMELLAQSGNALEALFA